MVFLGVLIFVLFWWRKRAKQRQLREGLAELGIGEKPTAEPEIRLLSDAPATAEPFSPNLPPPPMLFGALQPHDTHSQPLLAANANVGNVNAHHRASSSVGTLPNPYDGYVDLSDPFGRSLPSLPENISSQTALQMHPQTDSAALNDTILAAVTASSRASQAPSAWRASATPSTNYSDAANSRASSMTGVSSASVPTEEAALLGEMSSYQKRLESHHRKESEDAVEVASRIPADPPPSYSPMEDANGNTEAEHRRQGSM